MRIGKLVLLALVLGSLAAREGTGQAANLARTAKVKASSEYDQRYQARFAVDGQIPAGDSKA
ncbi:MAG: hypothetical protein FJ279_29725, partial [Planctomycetes bacterium]|nr:hypothetical protein [Planctomycetota bacterium]